MMSKKGSTIIRYIILFVFIGFVILFIYSTFKAIKDKNKIKTTENQTTLRMIYENSVYNPLNDVYSFSYFGYKDSNVAYKSSATYTTNALAYESNSNVYFYNTDDGAGYFNNTTSHLPKTYDVNIFNDNKLSISSSLYSSVPGSNSSQRNLWFNNGWYSTPSYVLYYNCNIPIESFNFTMYYNFPLTSSNTGVNFYVLTDMGGYCFPSSLIKFNSSTPSFYFSSLNILTYIPNATKVLRFGFAAAQSYSSTNANYYLPQATSSTYNGFNYYSSPSVYNNYYQSFVDVNQRFSLCYLIFSTSELNNNFVDGYNQGYNDGLNYNQDYVGSLSNQINSLNNQISSLNNTINNQSQIISQLQAQLNNSQNNFKDFFFTFVDIPIKTVHDMLNFEFFGLNLFRFFTGVLTALGSIWLIKKFI